MKVVISALGLIAVAFVAADPERPPYDIHGNGLGLYYGYENVVPHFVEPLPYEQPKPAYGNAHHQYAYNPTPYEYPYDYEPYHEPHPLPYHPAPVYPPYAYAPHH